MPCFWKKIKSVIKNKYFVLSFFVTALIIFMSGAMLAVDYNCRSVSFGDTSPLLAVKEISDSTYLEINMMGINKTDDVSAAAKLWKDFCDLICFPHS